MNHTYLRYECADSFGLVTSVGAASSTRAPPSDATLSLLTGNSSSGGSGSSSTRSHLLTTAGSHCTLWNTQTGLPVLKLGHADFTGVGTGQALNASQVLCLDVITSNSTASTKVATGWIDGAVRIFEISESDLSNNSSNSSSSTNSKASFSLLHKHDVDGDDDVAQRPDPLTLNGHAPSPVSSVSFEQQQQQPSDDATSDSTGSAATSLLASGGTDGTVIVWDLIAESGLFRLLGHQGAITQLHFLPRQAQTDTVSSQQGLISSSLDGLVKIWDLQAQCCVQTLANMRGEVWASVLMSIPSSSKEDDGDRHRLLTGSVDGQVRVWNLQPSVRQQEEKSDADGDVAMKEGTITTKEGNNDATTTDTETTTNKDDICHDMGLLEAPQQHLATSSSKADTSTLANTKDKVQSIRYSPYSRHVAILQANAKVIHVYSIRSVKEANRKKQRRLKRRQEKQKAAAKKESSADTDASTANSKKRGILDDAADPVESEQQADQQAESYDPDHLRASDEFEYCGVIKASHKVKAFVFCPLPTTKNNKQKKGTKTLVKVAAALSTNTIEMYSLERENITLPNQAHQQMVVSSNKDANLTPLYGHPTGVRAIALSSNDEVAATVSKGTCKVWKVSNRSCIQSVALEKPISMAMANKKTSSSSPAPTYQGLCAVWLPGNTHVVVGTREGHLLILDTAASEIVYWEEKAHSDAIWSIDIFHQKQQQVSSNGGQDYGSTSIVTGSADKMVKFWALERQGDDDEDDDDSDSDEVFVVGAPMLVPTRVLEMTDEVVAVKFSTSQFKDEQRRMVFVSTLDCTIKIFFEDSLKLFLSLYGHKLPALAVDASDDDTLLVSGSADKTIKLWGLDFGDTHRTLHGHQDSVTDVRFVRGTHNFFSASKDGTVRYWDGDRFELILVLRGHSAEINCLAVSARNDGAFVLSGSMDRSVRVWERTKDIVFLEEERERELEKMFDDPKNNRREEGGTANILDQKGRRDDADGNDADGDEMKQDEPQSEAAVKQSILSISSGDRLLEGIELADQELQALRQKGKDAPKSFNPMLLGMEPPQYILWVLRSIKSADLEQSLLVLPLGHAERLLYYLVLLLKAGHSSVELCCRVSVFTIKAHQNQLMLNHSTMAPLLRELRRLVQMRLTEVRDTCGYNIAACRMIGRIAQEHKESKMLSITPAASDVWAGLGLGSDVAAALEGTERGKRK